MARQDYDLLVIGAGSGGIRAARIAAQRGARVVVFESDSIGGTCVNLGCIPKKLLAYAASYGQGIRESDAYGWKTGESDFNWSTLIDNKDAELARLHGIYEKMLDNRGVSFVSGSASLRGPHEVFCAGEIFRGERILIATGGQPRRPELPGANLALTSDEMFSLPSLPERTLVYGAGYIGVEFASILQALGSKVTLAYRGDRILRHFDADIGVFLQSELEQAGVAFKLSTTVTAIEGAQDEGPRRVVFDDGTQTEVDCVLFATGRRPNVDRLGLEEVGVVVGSQGHIVTDEFAATSVKSIYAIGDVTGGVELTPVAIVEAMAFVRTVFDQIPTAVDYDEIPTAVFSEPQAATVGLSETAARGEGFEVEIYRTTFRPLRHSVSQAQKRVMMKLVVDRASDRVLGCHMVGPEAGEIVQGMAIALRCGATKNDFDRTVGIHPTVAEEFTTMRTPIG